MESDRRTLADSLENAVEAYATRIRSPGRWLTFTEVFDAADLLVSECEDYDPELLGELKRHLQKSKQEEVLKMLGVYNAAISFRRADEAREKSTTYALHGDAELKIHETPQQAIDDFEARIKRYIQSGESFRLHLTWNDLAKAKSSEVFGILHGILLTQSGLTYEKARRTLECAIDVFTAPNGVLLNLMREKISDYCAGQRMSRDVLKEELVRFKQNQSSRKHELGEGHDVYR